jgi:hypothetical protein
VSIKFLAAVRCAAFVSEFCPAGDFRRLFRRFSGLVKGGWRPDHITAFARKYFISFVGSRSPITSSARYPVFSFDMIAVS